MRAEHASLVSLSPLAVLAQYSPHSEFASHAVMEEVHTRVTRELVVNFDEPASFLDALQYHNTVVHRKVRASVAGPSSARILQLNPDFHCPELLLGFPEFPGAR